MNKKTMIGLGAMALILGVSGVMATSASAYRGDTAVHGPNFTTQRHESMEKAFETNNYLAWKDLMVGRGRVTEVINKDNFSEFAKAHELADKGDLAGAKIIRAKLGLGLKDGSGQSMRNGEGRGQGRGNCNINK